MAFTDLATVKTLLGIPATSTAADAAITAALEAAESLVLTELCLTDTARTSYQLVATVPDDEPTDMVKCCPRPVLAVTAGARGGVAIPAAELEVVASRLVRWRGGNTWSAYNSTTELDVELTVEAGWDVVPSSWSFAVAQFAASIYQDAKPWLKKETIGKYSWERLASTVGTSVPFPPMLQSLVSALDSELAGYLPIAMPA